MNGSSPVSLVTFDVEEFDAPLDFGREIGDSEQLRIGVEGWRRALDLLDECSMRTTLFITARIAEAAPELLRRSAAHHEIASHGFVHRTFEAADLGRSREVLRHGSGQPVLGFRRARLQPTDPAAIGGAGYAWDSSENPIWLPGRYNNLRRPRTPYRKGALVEVPVSASPRLRVPLFWLAMKRLPMPLVRHATSRCLDRDGFVHLFWHPWEIMPLERSGLPRWMRRPDGDAMLARLRDYLRWLGDRSRFESISRWLADRGEIDPSRLL